MTANSTKPRDSDNNFDAKRIARELDGLQPNARAHFLELFPQIKAAKERGVPTRQILGTLASHGLKFSAATFGKFYERASREFADAEFRKFVENVSRSSATRRKATTHRE
ncbi:hypothetical protein [Ralstonia pickettii]|uniref:hypothetical protein n=1 Tax=Ralstonia pickettii TaxID=329 RepID=UPI0015BEE5F3|nr:hypothetical protein [Ralstonia pickettii]NWK43318.1 hypothetical protein [Ralstonia pickettii]